MNQQTARVKIGVDLHNLSTRPDSSLRTGIQQVVFALLRSQHRLRQSFSDLNIELRPLPMLPLYYVDSRFTNLSPSHLNNSTVVLEEVSRELCCSPVQLWSGGLDETCKNWSDDYFYDVCSDLDWLIITGLCEFRHIAEKLKKRNPKLKIAVLVYDLGPVKRPELVAHGMSQWFKDCYLESVRLYADLVFTISRHTALDCKEYFSKWPNFNASIWSTPLPPEPPALTDIDDHSIQEFLTRYGLKKNKYFVAIGTIEPRKNLAVAVLGFNRFCELDLEATKDYRFIIIGKQGWRNEDTRLLEIIGSSADRFVFPGYLPRDEVELAMLLSCGLLMPSRLEGFGLPIALAMNYGVPTVTCNNTSLPEAGHVGSTFVTTSDPDLMALALWRLSATNREQAMPSREALFENHQHIAGLWDQYLKSWIDCIIGLGEDSGAIA